MRLYLRVLPKHESTEDSSDLVGRIRGCVESAPGINRIDEITPHPRGGYSVIADRDDALPDDFPAHIDSAGFMIAI